MKATAIFALLASGCASLHQSEDSRHLAMDSSWVRSTLNKEFFGFHRTHRMSPIVLDDLVIQGNAIDGIVAYNRRTGGQVWKLNLENGVEGGAQVDGDKLYFGSSNGQFYCVNVGDGKVVWTFPVRAETLAPPTVENGVVYFESGADIVFALDAVSGKQLWVYNRQITSSLSIRATTRPVVAGNIVLVGFSDGFVVALKKHDGGLLWERKVGKGKRFQDVDSTPVVDGGNFYVASFDGQLASLKIETGDINWTLEQGGYLPVTVGPGRWQDRLFLATAEGTLLSIDKASGAIKSSAKITKGIATQPSFYKGLLVYGESEGALVVSDPDTGERLALFDPGFGIMARPTVVDSSGEVYFISSGANLYAMRLKYQRNVDRMPWAAQ